MKEYPSIKLKKDVLMHTFDKIDGSNIRVEFTKKRGFGKFGTRTHLLDEKDKTFGEAVSLFNKNWNEDLTKIVTDNKIEHCTAYFEFWGEKSLGGWHDNNDEKFLTLIDFNITKKGFVGPEKFLELFGDLNISKYLGEFYWDNDFLLQVKNNEIPGITFEGVVGKINSGAKYIMSKAKTQQWIDAIKSRYTNLEAFDF